MNKSAGQWEEYENLLICEKCFGCDNQMTVNYAVWPKNQPFVATCNNCRCKQELYPQHRVVT